ncbi:NAD(P)-binding protein [Coprinopsis marcescibilis]|uniref:D-xylose 1-dehydrogenase (NADP(+), D-xylono-1,5-lactone-forming) n=1 Tax=Coprinopsis marcescibilis TaxID=230819 RepID=A0A5C3L0C1_COPMA|nr:NAD(P)-binding protein [Coprinopsis marcescibilis]
MASDSLYQLRWGIISTGYIATSFVKDLLVDPKTRDTRDVAHKVVAVGSRTVESAQAFIDRLIPENDEVKAYGSYDGVFADETVQAVYIGTPHTFHYDNALAAIKAGKHVLCEKPVTTNSAELRSLIAAAKEHSVFFMEAMWTRFQPLVKEVKKIAESGDLGKPVVLHADLSGDFDIHNIQTTHRILDPALGGGALLDLGPYPLVWAIIALYENPANNKAHPSRVTGAMVKTPISGVDSSTGFTLTFDPTVSSNTESSLAAQALLSCSITLDAPTPGVTIRFERGTITIEPPIYCPKTFKVTYLNKGVQQEGAKAASEGSFSKTFEYVGKGWHFQADEVARCISQGKLESNLWGHDKSLLEMEIFDEVRKQGNYVFPPGVEKVVEAV